MENGNDKVLPLFSHVEPVLAVKDISETISYWHDIIGFPAKWTWGDPPNHGGVSWQKVFIQFTLNPELAAVSKGNCIWIRLQHIDALYSLHEQNKAEIVAPLQNQPWGMCEYTIREINGYYVIFAAPVTDREKSGATLLEDIHIIGRNPTAREYLNLLTAVGWGASMNEAMAEKRLRSLLYAVVAEKIDGEVVGCALLLGDDSSFYYVKDVMVHPDWQGKRIGSALMHELTNWLEKNAAENALVALISGETLEPFYQQFGFAPAFSMIRYIHRNEKEG